MLGKKRAHFWKILSFIVLALVLVVGSVEYYGYTKQHPSSNDAYLNAHVVYITPQVSGQVQSLEVENYQSVKAGQLLFTIEPKAYQYAADQAEAMFLLDKAKYSVLLSQVQVANANLKKAEADLFTAKTNNDRISALVKNHQASPQEGDEAMGAYLAAQAQVSAMQESVVEAQKNVEVGKCQIEISAANAAAAALNLSYTQVTAPAAGRLAQFFVRPGDYVVSGRQVFELVEEGSWWIDTNYKETQLENIRSGQSAHITLDMYPNHVFSGKVAYISPSSGAAFSLLPPENATGNWVKVVQRYPVQINMELSEDEKSQYPLRVGASASVNVDVSTS